MPEDRALENTHVVGKRPRQHPASGLIAQRHTLGVSLKIGGEPDVSMPCIFSFFFRRPLWSMKTFVVLSKTFAQIDEAQERDLPLSVGARIWSDNDSNAVSVIESESVLGWG